MAQTNTLNLPIKTANIHYYLNDYLDAELRSNSRLTECIDLLSNMETVSEVSIYPDAAAEDLEGIGIPVGVSFITSGPEALVVPNGVSDPNDGYRVVALNIERDEVFSLRHEIIEAFDELKTKWLDVSKHSIKNFLEFGLKSVSEFGIDISNELNCVFDQGSISGAVPDVLSENVISLFQNEFGAYGTFSHFIELMSISGLKAATQQVEENQILLVIHGGAMRGGEAFFAESVLEFAESIATEHDFEETAYLQGFFGLPRYHPLAVKFLQGAFAVSNCAYAWRRIIQERCIALISKVLKKKISGVLLSELPHNRIEQTEEGIFHCKSIQPMSLPGTARLNSKEFVPFVVCGDIGIHSYLVRGTSQVHLSNFGCGHGRANVSGKPDRTIQYEEELLIQDLVTNQPEHLPQKASLKNLLSNIDESVFALRELGSLEIISKLQPIINFRGDPKESGLTNLF